MTNFVVIKLFSVQPDSTVLQCRYGRQTLAGAIKDGMSALSRYYLNNFHDGIRQARLLFLLSVLCIVKMDSSSQINSDFKYVWGFA